MDAKRAKTDHASWLAYVRSCGAAVHDSVEFIPGKPFCD